MKKFCSGLVLALCAGLFLSCTTVLPPQPQPYRPFTGDPLLTTIGFMEASFESSRLVGNHRGEAWQIRQWHSELNRLAHHALLESARHEHGGFIEIFDVSWEYLGPVGPSRFLYSVRGRVTTLVVGD